MNIWNYCGPRAGIAGVWDRIKFIPRAIKYSHQRVTKGFCDADTWNCGDNIDEYIIRMLKQFKEDCLSYNDRLYPTHEAWLSEISLIIKDLEYCAKEPDTLNPIADEYENVLSLPYRYWGDEEHQLSQEYHLENARIYKEQCAKRVEVYTKLATIAPDLTW